MRSDARGFTLIEVVVSLTILSMIVLATITAMRTLAKTQDSIEQRTEAVAHMRAVSRFIRSSLEQSQIIRLFQFGTPIGEYFYGSDRELVWAAPAPIPGVESGLWSLSLTLNEASQLVLRVRERISFVPWSEKDLHYVLADDVDAFEISYRDHRFADWESSWNFNEHDRAPSHVRIRIQASGRFWPELIVALPGKH